MKSKHLLLLFSLLFVLIYACRDDDGLADGTPERDRGEQQLVDGDSLISYLSQTYWNRVDFEGITNPSINDLVIETYENESDVPAGYAVLLTDPWLVTETIEIFDVDYVYYYLRINQGGGDESPTFSDNVRVTYEGFTLDNEVFDSAINPVDFDLLNLVAGWGRVLPNFNVALSFTSNGDGTITYNDAGVGVMFIPSGLGFFSASAPGVPLYSNLAFKFELYQYEENDHDNDGIPSYLEDVDGDTILTNDDNDNDNILDFTDPDDDNDGIATISEHIWTQYCVDTNLGETEPVLQDLEFEFSRSEEDGQITILTYRLPDVNGNGTFDYLEQSIDTNNFEEFDQNNTDCFE